VHDVLQDPDSGAKVQPIHDALTYTLLDWQERLEEHHTVGYQHVGILAHDQDLLSRSLVKAPDKVVLDAIANGKLGALDVVVQDDGKSVLALVVAIKCKPVIVAHFSLYV